MTGAFDQRSGEGDADAARARLVRMALGWRRALDWLTHQGPSRRIGGVEVTARRIVLGVLIEGVPLELCHGGAKPLRGDQKRIAREFLEVALGSGCKIKF